MPNATAVALDPVVVGRLEPLRPMPVHAVQAAMEEYQSGLHAILDETDWQTFADRDGRERRFVKRPGWRKVATWFGLDLLVGSVSVERDEHGEPLRALVTGRAVAPNGRKAEDVGACSITERRFSKPEHDLVATATTRALNRATANLVGMGELSAEELADEPEVPNLPDWAQPASEELRGTMRMKLAELVGAERADILIRAVDSRYGYVPNVTTGIVNAMHSMISASAEQTTTSTE